MKILYLTPYLPSPPWSGGSMRLHGLVSNIARRHSVSILSYVEPGADLARSLAATGAYADEIVTVENPAFGIDPAGKRARQLRSLVSRHSFERQIHLHDRFQAELDRLTEQCRFDLITIEFAQMGYFRFPESTPLVLDAHNVEYDIIRRTAKVDGSLTRRAYSAINYRKLRREERSLWRAVDGCAVTSERDGELVRKAAPGARVEIVPNAVDTDHFRPGDGTDDPPTLLFFGAIDYYPNTDGILYFLRRMFPELRQRYPDLRLEIVGRSPPDEVLEASDDMVTVTGFVDDVRPYIERATAVIVPLRIGGGTRLKVLEAMAMAKPIVSTSLGVEGITAIDGEHLLLADDPQTFIDQTGRLLDDAALRHRLGSAAHRLARERYDWRAAAACLEDLYEAVSGRPQPVAAMAGQTTAWT